MKDQLESLLARVLTWPEAAQHQLVRAAHEIEARYGGICSRCDNRRGVVMERAPPALGQPGFIADVETEAFFKRHFFNFL
jgi:hypothetical protein